ncbi:MAG: MFS transporter [Candidatus Omnitrophica bacterium]|nr:MFS transporter [Candidatus Omnitrophota bacterium]
MILQIVSFIILYIMWKKTFASIFTAQILSMIGFSFALPFLPFFISELGISDKGQQAFWAGIAIGVSGITFAIFSPLWGVLADRYGRKVMVCRSMFGGTLVLLLMSIVRTVGQLVACRLLQGILTGTISASIALVASVTPEERSGFTLGMMQAAAYIGTTIGPLFGGVLADLYGYRIAFRAGALLILAGGLLVLLGAKESFTPPVSDGKNHSPGFLEILTTSGFLMAVMILFGVQFSNSMISPSFPLIVKDILPSPEKLNSITGTILAASALAGACSAALLGHTGDRLGQKKVLIFCAIGASLSSAGHFFASSIPLLFVVRIIFGLSVAGMIPAANAIIYKIIDREYIGRAYGIATSISMIGFGLGTFSGGTLARLTGLRIPFLAVAFLHLLLASMIRSFKKIKN